MDILDDEYVNRIDAIVVGINRAVEAGYLEQKDVDRFIRNIFSQGNDMIAKDIMGVPTEWLSDPDVLMGKGVFAKHGIYNKINSTFEAAQTARNYAPGAVEGHHDMSVNSTEFATRHLPTRQRLETMKWLLEDYGVGGTHDWAMNPISKPSHQANGRGGISTGFFNAHSTANPFKLATSEGFPVDHSTWTYDYGKEKDTYYQSITDPRKLAQAMWERMGEPQLLFSDAAYDQKPEKEFRQGVMAQTGQSELNLTSHRQLPGVGKAAPKTQANTVRDQIRTDLAAKASIPTAVENIFYGGGMRVQLPPPPVVVPKPAPAKPVASKPKPAPTPRKNGDQAILGGKPVVWKDGRWVGQLKPPVSTSQGARKPGHVSLKDQIKTPPPKPAAPVGTVTKLPPKGTKAKPAAKPAPRGTGASRIRISEVAPPSTERHGPFGMIGTVDQVHERQHSWQQ